MNRLLAARVAEIRDRRAAAYAVLEAEHNEVMADDWLMDAVGSALPGMAGQLVDDELCARLLDWRDEVEVHGEIPDLVDVDTAHATIQAGVL